MIRPIKLSISLERQLTKIFAVATVLVVVAVVSGIYIANMQIRDAASNFISSHVKSLVESGVSTQNVSEIDREVRRLYVAWSQAQKTDLRISVLVDGVLVGKAGQLPPFGWMSSATVETKELPSGQLMEVRTETDFSRSSSREGVLIAIFVACFGIGFFVLRRLIARNIQTLTTPLEERMAWLKEVAKHLPDSVRGEILPGNASVEEIAQLDESLNSFVQQILRLEERVKEAGIKEGRVDMADRMAHALKGKLGILRLRIENMPGLTVDEKRKLRESVNGLMMSSREMLEAGRPLAQVEKPLGRSVGAIAVSAVRQRNEIATLTGYEQRLEISLDASLEHFQVESSLATGLEDAIIAIIDNALESSRDEVSMVHVICELDSNFASIRIIDSGCGIAPEILPLLMKERATFGKTNGNGLGLFHASELLKKHGGRIDLHSALGVGTTVVLSVPGQAMGGVKLEKQNFEYETAN